MAGVVQPLMVLVTNLNYIAVAVVGALQVTAGAMTIGGVQAFIQFSRLFSQPMGQIGGMLTLVQSCLASAERVFDLLDAAENPAENPADDRAGNPAGLTPPGRAAPGRVAFDACDVQLQPRPARGAGSVVCGGTGPDSSRSWDLRGPERPLW